MSSAETAVSSAVVFEGVTPIVRVADLDASIDYYVRVLGFKVDWRGPQFASVSRGKCYVFLCRGDQGHAGTWVWVGVSDAEQVLAEYRASGAKIRHEPTNYPWAYEMQVEDLDGNVLRMGSEPKDAPTGEWLDMDGRRWQPVSGGGWKREE